MWIRPNRVIRKGVNMPEVEKTPSSWRIIRAYLAVREFGTTTEMFAEIKKHRPNFTQKQFHKRLTMAKADHLVKSEQRGVYKLTQKGRAELNEPHTGIDKSRDIPTPQPTIPTPSRADGQTQVIPQVPEAAKRLWSPKEIDDIQKLTEQPEDLAKSEGFWMVYVQDRQMPTVQHKTYEIAEQEAERLTRKEGKTVWLLKTVAKFELEPAPVVKKRL